MDIFFAALAEVVYNNDNIIIDTPGAVVENLELRPIDQAKSAIIVKADNVTIRNVTIIGNANTRMSSPEQSGISIIGAKNVRIENVRIENVAGAGILVYDASNFVIVNPFVKHSMSDGIHITGGSRDGIVKKAVVEDSGDDGFAVVSYLDSGLVENVLIESSTLRGNRWGRGFSIVGGNNITYRNIYARDTSAAGLYIASESSWNTYGVTNATVYDATLERSNYDLSIDHGSILVYGGNPGQQNINVRISKVFIVRPINRPTNPYWEYVAAGVAPNNVYFSNIITNCKSTRSCMMR